jgi:pimeloyl-ACP methyl ester carboxylesterase
MRSAASAGGMRALLRSARWFLGSHHDRTLSDLAATGIPRAIVWAEADTLIPSSVGKRAAELLGCELHIVGRDNGWPGQRAPDHDWPFRQPAHFADTIARVIASLQRARRPRNGGRGAP